MALPGLAIADVTSIGDTCRVQAVARPRPGATIGLEVWLPDPARWSGRYYQMGNGGFAGRYDARTLAAAALRGDVAAATDTGHKGDGFDARWARGRPDLIADYASRSIKVTADAAAALTRAYYGAPARHRYFMGCSFGGRQALVAASRWPSDWEGIIAGAPATDWPVRITAFATIQRALRLMPGGWIAPERIAPLAAVALAACTTHGRCTAHALRRACRAGQAAACLVPAQLDALRTIEAAGYPLRDADPAEWARWIVNPDPAAPAQSTFATGGFRYLLADRPGWTLNQRPVARADRIRLFAIGRLDDFAARGGKVVSYFGGADAVLPPARARDDARRLGATDGFYRLFQVPGMAHCQGGALPAAFGQSLEAPSASDDPAHDIRRALEAWVERGEPPMALLATTGPAGAQRLTRLVPTRFGERGGMTRHRPRAKGPITSR